METILVEWLSLAVRWIHIITAFAWIGASFYFNWLLNHLLKSDDPKVAGQLWALHAGGFFNVEKRNIEPGRLPSPLHWFKWESYWTWLSGFSLLVITYYLSADAYLIDPSVLALQPWQAILISLGFLLGSWLVYHTLWKTEFARQNTPLAMLITVAFIVLLAIALTHIFSGRGAFLQLGAMLATWMTANVFFVIMPGQRKLVKATLEGQPQDKRLSEEAGWRSLHNNYLTLPVMFCMISNHYPASFGSVWNWVVLLGLFVVGVLVRHYFNARTKVGNWKPLWLLILAFIIFVGTAIFASYPQIKLSLEKSSAISYKQVQTILVQRCVTCHAAQTSHPAFPVAQKGVLLETEDQARKQAALIAVQVASKAMPLGNLTQMTDEERSLIVKWAQQVQRP
ncbi:MAG: urate hydroxylase PuuD [Thiolinea sp.]